MLRAAVPGISTVAGTGVPTLSHGGAVANNETFTSAETRQTHTYGSGLLLHRDGQRTTRSERDRDTFWNDNQDMEKPCFRQKLGPVPSMEEVFNATEQLEESLKWNTRRIKGFPFIEASTSAGSAQGNSQIIDLERELASIRGKGIVAQALNMFESDRDVRSAVVSLAQDPEVWKAIQQNEGVRNLLHRRRQSTISSQLEMSDSDCLPEMHKSTTLYIKKQKNSDPLGEFLLTMLSEINNVRKNIASFAAKLFGCGDESRQDGFQQSSDAEEEAIFPTVLILTVLIVSIVVFNRPVGV